MTLTVTVTATVTQDGMRSTAEVDDVEFEYIRHGTLCLMANFDVVTGRLISPTRTEDAFVAHIEKTIDTDPEAPWIFVVGRFACPQP